MSTHTVPEKPSPILAIQYENLDHVVTPAFGSLLGCVTSATANTPWPHFVKVKYTLSQTVNPTSQTRSVSNIN